MIRACCSFFPISPRFIGVFFTSFLFFLADAIVPSLNSYDLLSFSYIVVEDKSFEEPRGNRDEGVERVEGSREAQCKLSAHLVSHNECP